MSERRQAEFREPNRSWVSHDDDSPMRNYMGMSGRISVASLLAHMATIAPRVRPEEMMLNWATVVWEDESTDEEQAKRREWVQRQAKRREWVQRQAERREWVQRQAERTEEWERKTYARLSEKFATPSEPTP
jgi:hypothetical protein